MASEQTPLLQQDDEQQDQGEANEVVVQFDEKDEDDPRQWSTGYKYFQVSLFSAIAVICPLASSIYAPGIDLIAEDFGVSEQIITGGQTAFVVMLGIGPLFLAPMSEAFGRRNIFLINVAIFTLLQIPAALAPNVATFIVVRTLQGLFGSVGVANGGGSVSDMFETSERATPLGYYMLAPLLGPTIGPLLGGIIVSYLEWRWVFWILLIISAVMWTLCYFLLHETMATILLQRRSGRLQRDNPDKRYVVDGVSKQSMLVKIRSNCTRAIKILVTQPAVLTMSAYQALVFASLYSLYTAYPSIWKLEPYNFNRIYVALAYLGPTVGFLLTVVFIVPNIDKVYNRLAARSSDGQGKPEYRLPLANIGAVLLPISLFWFGWAIEYKLKWPTPLAATLFFGACQLSIFNTVQNYYIDSFESAAASALAAGSFLRSVVGGVVPLFVPQLFETVGYGWGMSVFGFVSVALMPAPLLFYRYGASLREKFKVDL